MDAALDMRRAAQLVDKITPDGTRYCQWSMSSLDASDLDLAISRFLLNHASRVPDNIPASKMWHVSLILGDIIHQFSVAAAECLANIRYSDDARRVWASASPIIERLITARDEFDHLAYEQTLWEEASTSLGEADNYNRPLPDTGQVEPRKFQKAVRELKSASEAAHKVSADSSRTKGCVRSQTGWPEQPYLNKLIDYFDHTPSMPGYVPAGNMWGASPEGLAAQFDIFITVEACLPYSGEKRQARKRAGEALRAYHRLTEALAEFDSLALQQTEWEERNVEGVPQGQEH